MEFYSKRLKSASRADREAQGENFWTHEFNSIARNRIFYAVLNTVDNHLHQQLLTHARTALIHQHGLFTLANDVNPVNDFQSHFFNGTTEDFLDCVESLIFTLGQNNFQQHYSAYGAANKFTIALKAILEDERISYEVESGQLIPFESKVLFANVVRPVLTLLNSSTNYEKIEKAYLHALEQISTDPANAITDCGTALQETFNALGLNGKSLGPLIDDGISKSKIASQDKKLFEWISANRSNRGDGHKVVDSSKSDAWLMLHVCGAVIIHLLTNQDILSK